MATIVQEAIAKDEARSLESFVSAESRTVFIIGSGFSKDIAGLPLLRDLSREVLEIVRSTADSGNKNFASVLDCIEGAPAGIQKNVEYLLSLLRSNSSWLQPFEAALRQGASRAVCKVIADFIEETEEKSEYRNKGALDSLLKYWKENQSVLITFNYDTLIERRAAEIFSTEHTFLDPGELYVGAFVNLLQRTESGWAGTLEHYFRLVKLHGSINWYYSGNERFSGEPLYYDPLIQCMPLGVGLGEDTRLIVERNKQDLEQLVVPPLLNKDPLMDHSLLRLQWREAFKALRKADTVYVLGYSLPTTDLAAKFMVMEATKGRTIEWNIFLHEKDIDQVKPRFLEILDNVKFHSVAKGHSSTSQLIDLLLSSP